MNEKQGDLLDQRIRQALSNLPDAPPPGSPFDSARLWEQLRPELSAPPVARKRVAGWWWAAASVVGLMVGWFFLWDTVSVSPVAKQVSVSHSPSAKRGSLHPHPRSAKRGQVPSQTAVAGLTYERSVRTQTENADAVQGSGTALGHQAKNAVPNRADGPTEHRSIVQSQPVTPEPVSLTPVAEIQIPTVAITPKRRFRVVHENELVAEDEAHRVRYANEGRTERFVRLGTGSPSQPRANEELPSLQLPLNRKTTQ